MVYSYFHSFCTFQLKDKAPEKRTINMNMSQLIEELSERTGYHPHDTDRVVRIFFDSIKNAIAQKDKVEIRGFGSFNLSFNFNSVCTEFSPIRTII